jgi:hypothetical protein
VESASDQADSSIGPDWGMPDLLYKNRDVCDE